jgi:hypothetical protein
LASWSATLIALSPVSAAARVGRKLGSDISVRIERSGAVSGPLQRAPVLALYRSVRRGDPVGLRFADRCPMRARAEKPMAWVERSGSLTLAVQMQWAVEMPCR